MAVLPSNKEARASKSTGHQRTTFPSKVLVSGEINLVSGYQDWNESAIEALEGTFEFAWAPEDQTMVVNEEVQRQIMVICKICGECTPERFASTHIKRTFHISLPICIFYRFILFIIPPPHNI